MSAGHHVHRHRIDAKRSRELDALMKDRRFLDALAKYTKTDESHQIPYLGGSSRDGTTIYFDKNLPKNISVGGQRFDPRQFLRVHEAVEGILIRLYDMPYVKAHDFATVEERRAVEKAGHKWPLYEEAFKPLIRTDEHETGAGMPHDLLMEPYKGSRFYKENRNGR